MAFAVISTDSSIFVFDTYNSKSKALKRFSEVSSQYPNLPLVCVDYHEPDSEEDGTIIAMQNMQ